MTTNPFTLPDSVLDDILKTTHVADVRVGNTLQTLWGGYGSIVQLQLLGTRTTSAILKLIQPPQQSQHPRGWNTAASHQRKIRSYQIETQWYQHYADQCDTKCKVPAVIATANSASKQWILMEDLTDAYPGRAVSLNREQAAVCLRWLAAFHAKFLKYEPVGLWDVGTYWHLGTRQDELQTMPDSPLKTMAAELDAQLSKAEFRTIVHGDAKVANFCFSQNMDAVAAVDFQYVGGGVGIKDVVYFLGSCLHEDDIEQHEADFLSVYFESLHDCVSLQHGPECAALVEQEWSALYAIAWTDFYRFLEGWMPGHNKINRYTKQLATRAFAQLSK